MIFFITRFVTCVRNFVIHVTKFLIYVSKFVTNVVCADSENYQGVRKKELGLSEIFLPREVRLGRAARRGCAYKNCALSIKKRAPTDF